MKQEYLDKANELIKKFEHYAHSNPNHENDLFYRRLKENSIQCAKIAVNEIISNIDATILYHKDSKALPINKDYWINVREALNCV